MTIDPDSLLLVLLILLAMLAAAWLLIGDFWLYYWTAREHQTGRLLALTAAFLARLDDLLGGLLRKRL